MLVRRAHSATAYVIGAAGRIKRRIPLRVPAGLKAIRDSLSLKGGTILRQYVDRDGVERRELARVGGRPRAITLPGAFYELLTPTLAYARDTGTLARLDPARGRVVEVVDVPGARPPVTPFGGGGAVAGLGQVVYDRDLDVVASNAGAVQAPRLPFVVAHAGRLYARVVDCDTFAARVLIVEPRTGETVGDRKGKFAVGELGGRVSFPNDDDCD